ncbi:peptidoglycan-recognition protein SC2-like [Diadema antillarum]|uniref:peptidoglycan-recognition protein SC2-like n=1 Tax=Diadema antillarum TaxID=105358 RepID=UPI003A83F2AF
MADVRTADVDPAFQEIGSVSCPRIVTRSEWGARSPTSYTWLSLPTPYAIVHHTDGASCYTESACKSQVKGIQNYHMDSNGWWDIGYNFLIGGDGNVYEGRGWYYKGSHASSYNGYALGISMIGDFDSTAPSSLMMETLYQFLDCAVSKEMLTPGYTLFGHRQAVSTTCPGNSLYYILDDHDHYQYISGSVDNPKTAEQCSL